MAKKKMEVVQPKVEANGTAGAKTWSGHITTGPISIEVAMFAAARTERVGFNMLHSQCHGRIKQAGYYCPCCVEVEVVKSFLFVPANADPAFDGIELKAGQKLVMHADDANTHALAGRVNRTSALAMVENDEIVKGFEYAKDTFAIVSRQELEALKPISAKTLEIKYFVAAAEVDPVYFESSYYMPPLSVNRAYAMLRQGMIAKGVMAVGRICVRNSESTVFIKPHVNGGLVAYTAYATDEVRAVNVPAEPVLSPAEIKAVSDYIEANTAPLDLSEFKDEYRARVTELVEAKKNGGTIQAVELPKPKPTETVDLVAMFSMSAKIAIEQRAARKTA